MSIFYKGMRTSILFATSAIKKMKPTHLRIFVGLILSINVVALTSHQNASAASEITPEVLPNLLLSTAANPFAYSLAGETVTFQYVVTNNGPSIIGPVQITINDEKIDSGTAFNCGNSDTLLTVSMSITCSRDFTILQSDLEIPVILTRAVAHAANFDSNLATVTLVNAISSTTTSSSTTSILPGSTTTSTFPSRRIDIGSIPEIAVTSSNPTDSRPPGSIQLVQNLPITGSNTNLFVGLIFGLVIFGSLLLNVSNHRQKSRQHNNQQNRGKS